MATATVQYRAELSALKAELKTIEGITAAQAAKMASDLNKSLKAIEKAQKDAQKALGDTGNALGDATRKTSIYAQTNKNLGFQVADVIQSIQAGQNPMRALTIQMSDVGFQYGSAAVAAHGFKGVLAAMATTAGPVVIAIAALAAIYAKLRSDLKEAEAAQKAASDTAAQAQTVHAALEVTIAGVAQAYQLATGEIDRYDVALGKGVKGIEASFRPQILGQAKLAQATKDRIALLDTQIAAERLDREELERLNAERRTATDVLRRQQTAMEALKDRQNEVILQASDTIDIERDASQATKASTSAREHATKASTARADALRAEQEAEARVVEAMEQSAAASEQLAAIAAGAASSRLSDEEAITSELRRQLFAVAGLERASGDTAAASRARVELLAEAERDRAELAQAAEAKLQRAQEQRINKVAAAEAASAQNRAQAQADLYSAIEGFAGAMETRLGEEHKAAAIGFFLVSQAAAVAQAILATKLAAAEALAVPPAPNLIAAGVAVATGALQVAAIAAVAPPSFSDTPGMIRAGNRGMTATFAPGDRIMASRDDAGLVRQMQRAGLGGGSGGSDVLVRDADRHLGRYGRDPLRPPRAYTSLKRRAGRVPGRK